MADIHPLYEELFFYLIKWKQKTLQETFDPFVSLISLGFNCALGNNSKVFQIAHFSTHVENYF